MAKAKKSEVVVSPSPYRRGKEAVSAASRTGGVPFVSLKDGENIVIAPLHGLDEMISADMHEYWDIRPAIFHPCIGPNCPGCEVGNQARFKGYLPVVSKEGDVMVWPFTIKVERTLEELEEAIGGDLGGHVLRVKRNGSGKMTNYTIVGSGKTVKVDELEVPDYLAALGPTDREEIVALLVSRGLMKPTGEFVGTGDSTPFGVDDDETDDDDWEGV